MKDGAGYGAERLGNGCATSIVRYELNKDKFKVGKEIEEIEDLIEAYEFA